MKTPVKDMLDQYAASRTQRYHMPGHKGLIYPQGSHDITEIYCSDDLYSPRGPLLELELELAELAGSRSAFMLTDGSSAGVRIICMCLKAIVQGKLLLSGNIHRSVIDGCVLADLQPVIVPDDELINSIVPGVSAVLTTSPDYYGRMADLAEIKKRCDACGAILAVDEAHGAHLSYIGLPCAAAIADICVQSMHKTMGALTQAALLHVNNASLLPYARRFMRMLCTSSPSYLIMESMESAAEFYLRSAFTFLEKVKLLRLELTRRGIALLNSTNCDPTRLSIRTAPRCSGLDAASQLISSGIVPEMADNESVVFILTPYDSTYAPLLQALSGLKQTPYTPLPYPPAQGKTAFTMRAAALAKTRDIPLRESEGRIISACAGLYPPGIPCIYPGQIITKQHIAYLAQCTQNAETFGLNGSLVSVVSE